MTKTGWYSNPASTLMKYHYFNGYHARCWRYERSGGGNYLPPSHAQSNPELCCRRCWQRVYGKYGERYGRKKAKP